MYKKKKKKMLIIITEKNGVMGESNPRPPAPKAGIIPLDQSPFDDYFYFQMFLCIVCHWKIDYKEIFTMYKHIYCYDV